jgi:hypothetical protein
METPSKSSDKKSISLNQKELDFTKSSLKNFKITLISRNNTKEKIGETQLDTIQNMKSSVK